MGAKGEEQKEGVEVVQQPAVLVVDDNEVNRKILARMLISLGWRVQTANDGLEAVEAFRAGAHYSPHPFHCAFFDICMPHMDGHEATRHVRRMGFQTPIIALTANAMDEERQKSVAAGMNFFLTKPLRKSTVICMLDTVSALHSTQRQQQQLQE